MGEAKSQWEYSSSDDGITVKMDGPLTFYKWLLGTEDGKRYRELVANLLFYNVYVLEAVKESNQDNWKLFITDNSTPAEEVHFNIGKQGEEASWVDFENVISTCEAILNEEVKNDMSLMNSQEKAAVIKQKVEKKFEELKSTNEYNLPNPNTLLADLEYRNMVESIIIYPSFDDDQCLFKLMAFKKHLWWRLAKIRVYYDISVATKEEEEEDHHEHEMMEIAAEGPSDDSNRIIERLNKKKKYVADRPITVFAQFKGRKSDRTKTPMVDDAFGYCPQGAGLTIIKNKGMGLTEKEIKDNKKQPVWVMAHETGHFFVGAGHPGDSKLLMEPDEKGYELRWDPDVTLFREMLPFTRYNLGDSSCSTVTPGRIDQVPSLFDLLITL